MTPERALLERTAEKLQAMKLGLPDPYPDAIYVYPRPFDAREGAGALERWLTAEMAKLEQGEP